MASERASTHAAVAKKLGAGVLVVGALAFAVQGGEFGTFDLIRQWRDKARLVHAVDSLRVINDSLAKYENALEHDPATQERIAREVFGMVRGDKEVVYRLQP